MNCQDIAWILDDGDLRSLDSEVHQRVATHLAGCAACARVWGPLIDLAVVPMAAMPPDLAERCASLVAAEHASRGRAARFRPLIVGAVLAFAAAAAMLTSHLFIQQPAPQPASRQDLPAGNATPAVATPPDAAGTGNAAAAPATVARQGNASVPAASRPTYEVRMLPLSNEAADGASADAVAAFYASLVAQLRALPRIKVVSITESPGRGDPATGSTIKVRGSSTPGTGKYQVSVSVDEWTEPSLAGAIASRAASSMAGNVTPACDTAGPAGDPQCNGPETLAARVVSFLRTRVLPPDESLRQSNIAALRDPTLSAQRRFQALGELWNNRSVTLKPGGQATSLADGSNDPALVAGAIELAAETADAEQRASIWRAMRQVNAPQLLQPLLDASRLDPAAEVRAEAVAALARNFASDARARATLEAVAREDSHGMVKALARRGLSGEETWNAYVVQSLADRSRTPAERMEPLLFHVRQPSSPGGYSMYGWNVIGGLLDDGATQALVEVLPEVYAASIPQTRSMLSSLVSTLAYNSRHPAFTQMVLDNLEGPDSNPEWLMAAEGMMRRPGEQDPRLRTALENVAADHSSEQARQAAERLLRSAPPVVPAQRSAQ